MSRKAKCVIIAEDLRTQRLLRYYAMHLFDSRSIEPRDLPAGSGAGDQYIRECYAEEVAEYRRLNKGLRSCVLIVHIDADTRSVESRAQQLDRCLATARLEKREAGEAISLVIPKRHTETWLCWHAGIVPTRITTASGTPIRGSRPR